MCFSPSVHSGGSLTNLVALNASLLDHWSPSLCPWILLPVPMVEPERAVGSVYCCWLTLPRMAGKEGVHRNSSNVYSMHAVPVTPLTVYVHWASPSSLLGSDSNVFPQTLFSSCLFYSKQYRSELRNDQVLWRCLPLTDVYTQSVGYALCVHEAAQRGVFGGQSDTKVGIVEGLWLSAALLMESPGGSIFGWSAYLPPRQLQTSWKILHFNQNSGLAAMEGK